MRSDVFTRPLDCFSGKPGIVRDGKFHPVVAHKLAQPPAALKRTIDGAGLLLRGTRVQILAAPTNSGTSHASPVVNQPGLKIFMN